MSGKAASFDSSMGPPAADPVWMKHLVANAAHDLKTPLASFMTGANLVAEFTRDLEKNILCLIDNEDIASVLLESIDNIKGSLKDIVNTNSFMLMTIHRLQDYTKASSGMKLQPKNETCELAETLRLPLLCMQNLAVEGSGSIVRMEPLPSEICNSVITDKQWLQENLLCLLSNGVKYSNNGEVVASVKLMHASSPIKATAFTAPSMSSDINSSSTMQMKHEFPLTPEGQPSSSDNDFFRRNWPPIVRKGTSEIWGGESPLGSRKAVFFNSGSKDLRQQQRKALVEDMSAVLPVAADEDLFGCSTTSADSPLTPSKMKPPVLLCIEVTDSGIGVPNNLKSQLFQPFQQTQRMAGGTGLGLYSLAKRCEALQGEYGVRDREDGQAGSVFYFAVPYRPDEAAATAATTASLQRVKYMISRSHSKSVHVQSPLAADNSRPAVFADLTVNVKPRGSDGSGGDLYPEATLSTPVYAGSNYKDRSVGSLVGSPSFHSSYASKACVASSRSRSTSFTNATNASLSSRSSRHARHSQVSALAELTLEPEQKLSALTILLVEDSATIAKMTCALLKRQGHAVTVAVNGAVALDLITIDPSAFDIVLMDLQMPVMDGLEATRRIRLLESDTTSNDATISKQRIVGLSANSDPDTLAAASSAGFDAFMEKPIQLDVFATMVEDLLAIAAVASSSGDGQGYGGYNGGL